jgi:predicted ester cyclase
MDALVARALRLWSEPLPPGDAALAAFRDVYLDPIRVNGTATALEVLVERSGHLQDALADLAHHVDDVVVTAGRRAIAFRISGRHVGRLPTPLGPVAPTGRTVEVAGLDIFEVDEEAGRITAVWAVADYLGLLASLDAVTLRTAQAR